MTRAGEVEQANVKMNPLATHNDTRAVHFNGDSYNISYFRCFTPHAES